MTRQFFTTGEASHVAGNNDIYYGLTTGSQTVNIPAGVTGVVVNADVEQVNFAGNISDYKFLQQGNSVLVKNVAGTTVATLRVQGDTDGTQLKFGDSGVFNAILANGAVKVGGAAISNNDNGDVAAAAPSATPNAGTVTTPAYVITSSATSVDEGTTVTFTVTAAAAASVDRTFDYQIKGAAQGVAAAAQTADFSTTNGTFTIKANQVTGTILVTPLADNAPDDYYEGFNVSIIDNTFNVIKTSDNVVIRNTSYAPTENKLTVSATDVVTNPGNSAVTFIGQVGQTTTLQASDKVTGNGLNDTLRIVTDTAGTTTAGFTVTGVKTLEVQAQASGTTVLGLENVTGLTNVRTASSTKDLTLNNVNNVVDLSFQNTIDAADVTVNYTSAATVGTTDVQNISLNNNTLGIITVTGIETVSINTTGNGGASTLGGLATAATVLKVAGNQNLTITNPVYTLSNVDAGALTGTLDITAGQNTKAITVIGGSNNDRIDVQTATSANVNINTGEGTNTVIMGATYAVGDSVVGGTGVDTVRVTNIATVNNANTFATSSALNTLEFTVAQGSSVVLDADTTGATKAGFNTYGFVLGLNGPVTLNNVVDNVNVNILQTTGGGSLTLTKPSTVTAGTSNINFSTKSDNEAFTLLQVSSDETLKINATDSDTTSPNSLSITTLTANAALKTLLVSGNEDVTLGNNLSTAASNLATITSTTTGAFSVNASGAAALTVTAAGTGNTITTGTGADIINANGTQTISVNASSGNNTVNAVGGATYTTGITTGAGNDKITVTGNGTNTITTGNGDDIVTVSGTGNSTINLGIGVNNITLFAGTNLVDITAGNFTSADTIKGGTGTDTVKVTSGGIALTDGSFYNLKSVEGLYLQDNTTVTVNQIANVEGLTTITLNGAGNDIVNVGEGFINPLTVNVISTGYENITATVNTILSASAITVKANANLITGDDTISGGSSANDNLILTANGTATLTKVSSVETITVAANTTVGGGSASDDISIDINSNTITTGTLKVNAAALTDLGATLNLDARDIDGNGTTTNVSVTGGNGADSILGSAGSDTINGGIGADVITGDNGADILTGGAGIDQFIYTALSNSSSKNTDIITDFTSGTDKIIVTNSLINAPLSFALNQGSFSSAQGAISAGGDIDYVFQTDNNTLWIDINNDGALNGNDIQIKLQNTPTLVAADVDITYTGNAITLAALTIPVVNTSTSNAVNSMLTTAYNDTITSAASTALVGAGAAINGGSGDDTLNLTLATANTPVLLKSLTAAGADGVALTSIEYVNALTTIGSTLDLGSLPADLKGITVTATNDNGALTATTTAANQTVTVNNTVATTGSVITVGAFQGNVVNTGSAADTVNISTAGSNINTGAGNDTIQVTNLNALNGVNGAATNVLQTINGGAGTNVLAIDTGKTGIINLSASNSNLALSNIQTLTLGAAAAGGLAVTLPALGLTTLTGSTATAAITVDGTAAAISALTTITSSSSSNSGMVFTASDVGSVITTINAASASNWSVTYAAAASANVTEAKNFAVTGTAAADVLNITASLGAVTVASTGFETVNFTTAAQAAAVTAPVGATTITSSVAQVGLTIAAVTTAVTTSNATGTAVIIDNAIASSSTTFTHTGAGALTVTLTAEITTAANDIVTSTGTGAVTVINAVGSGTATVNLNANNAAVDTINFQSGNGIVAAADRVTVNGFSVANDIIALDPAQDTTTFAGQKVFASAGAVTIGTGSAGGANSYSTFAFDMGDVVDVLSGVTDGAALIQNNGAITVTSADAGYILAYDNGNAYLYAYTNGGGVDTSLVASEIALIGVFNGVATGAISNANFSV